MAEKDLTISNSDDAVNETANVIEPTVPPEDKKSSDEQKSNLPKGKSKLTAEEQAAEDFAASFMRSYTVPVVAETMMDRDRFKDVYNDKFVEKYGSKTKANEEMDKLYEMLSKKYQEVASAENNDKVLENIAFQINDVSSFEIVSPGSESVSGNIAIVPGTISGRSKFLSDWTGPTRTMREASLATKKVIDYKGDVIEYEDSPYELAHEDKYVDDKGNQIKAFTYLPYNKGDEYYRINNLGIKAVYEGEDVIGELVSRYDASNWFLKGNTLDTSVWKVAVGTVFDFVVDTVDTLMALGQWQMQLYSLGFLENTGFYKGYKDIRTTLQTAITSKSDADQNSYVTLNNAVNLGINVALQLLTGKEIAKGMSSILKVGMKSVTAMAETEKVLEVTKTSLSKMALKPLSERAMLEKEALDLTTKLSNQIKSYNKKSNIVKGTTLLFMGAMQAKETGDAAKAAGFSETESALIYFASLGSMALANKISDFGFEGLGLNVNNAIVKKAVQSSVAGITPAKGGVMKMFKATNFIADNVSKGLRYAMTSKGIAAGATREALEEEAEYILDQVVRHSATALGHLGYDSKDAPKFLTAMDEGYWDQFFVESMMNMVGGAMGGAMMTGAGKLVRKQKVDGQDITLDWPQSGKAAEVFKFVAFNSTRNSNGANLEMQLYKHLDKSKKKGWLGREDISSKWDAKNGRYKRVNELTTEDKANGHASQADVQIRAIKAQYEYYKHIYKDTTKTFDELKNDNTEFDFITDGGTLYEEVRNLYDEKRKLYAASAGGGDIDFDIRLDELQRIKDKAEPDSNGTINNTKYDQALTDLIGVTKLSKDDLERLVKINKQLNDIRTGKAFESMFLKHHVRGSRISFDDLVKLVTADKTQQTNFKESLETKLNTQKENDDAILAVIDNELAFLPALRDVFEKNKGSEVYFSEDVKSAMKAKLSTMGVTLNNQKETIIEKILPNLRQSAEDVLKHNNKFFRDSDDTLTGEQVVNEFLNEVEAAAYDGPEALENAIKSNTNLKFVDPGSSDEEGQKKVAKFLYNIKKLLEVNSTQNTSGFKDIKYDPENLEKNAVSGLISFEANRNNDVSFFELLQHHYGSEDSMQPLYKLFADNDTEFENVLDPYLNIQLLQNIGTKTAILSHINAATSHTESDTRSDLVYGFIRHLNGDIESGTSPLYKIYDDLISGFTDKDSDEVSFFTDIDAAQKYLDQVETRIAEIELLISAFPMLAKIDTLNKTKFGLEEGDTNAFFTEYIEQYIIPLKTYKDNPMVPIQVFKWLNSQLDHLKIYEEKAKALVSMAKNSSEDIGKKYTRAAVEKAGRDLKRIHDSLLSPGSNLHEAVQNSQFKDDIDEINKLYNSIFDKFNDYSNANVILIYDTIAEIKVRLNAIYKAKPKNAFLDIVKSSFASGSSISSIEKVLLYAMSDPNIVQGKLKAILETIDTSTDEALIKAKLATAEQITLVESVVTAATDDSFLETMAYLHQKEDNNWNEMFKSGIFINGRQGSGKTSVILPLVAELIDGHVNRTDLKSGIVVAADNESQRDNILKNLPQHIPVVKVDSANLATQKQIYELFVNNNVDTLVNKLEHVNAIFYDEVTKIEYDGSENAVKDARKDEKSASTLGAILAKLEKVNVRRKNAGKAKLLFIGLGDETQPGFVVGNPSPKNGWKNTRISADSGALNALTAANVYRPLDKLHSEFRSDVAGMSADINIFQTTLDTHHKPFKFRYSKKDNVHFGIKFEGAQKSFADLATNNAIIDEILKRLEEDPDATVGIVAGEFDEDTTLMLQQVNGSTTPLVEKLINNPNPDIAKRIHKYSLDSVQGSEHTYILANLDSGFFNLDDVALDNPNTISAEASRKFKNKIQAVKMLLGRAQQFAIVTYQGALAAKYITSTEANDLILNKKIDSLDFKKNWLILLKDGILKSGTALPAVQKAIDADVVDRGIVQKEEVTEFPVPTAVMLVKTGATFVVYNEDDDRGQPFVNDTSSEKEATDIVAEIAGRYKAPPIVNFTKEEIDNLISIIEKVRAARLKEQAQKDIHVLKNISEILNDEETDEQVLETFNSMLDEQAENNNKSENEIKSSDKKFMVEAEQTRNLNVAYLDFQSSNPNDNPDTVRHLYASRVYGDNALPRNDINFAISKAISYDANKQVIFNKKDYDFFIVTSLTKMDNSNITVPNIVLAAKPKGSTSGVFYIAQFPKASELAKFTGSLGSFVASKLDTITRSNSESDEESPVHTRVADGYTVKFIESEITPDGVDAVFQGLTVGNLVTYDAYSYNKLKGNSEFHGTVPGKMIRSKVIDTRHINKLNVYKDASGWITAIFKNWEDVGEDSPFVSIDEKKKFIRKLPNGQSYVIVKTSIGNIPFLLNGKSSALPIVGMHDGKIIVAASLVDRKTATYIDELSIISKMLSSLNATNPDDYTTVVKDIATDLAEKDINAALNVTMDLANVTPADGEALVRTVLTRKFLSRSENFFGNKKVSLPRAIKLWEETGDVPNMSKVCVLTRGRHKGKAVMFYTFNKNIQLENYSESQLIQLYKDMATNINESEETPFTTNRLGIGFLFLDPVAKTFTDLKQTFTAVNTTAATFNKATLTKDNERKLLALCAHIYGTMSPNKAVLPIVNQLKALEPGIEQEVGKWVDDLKKDINLYNGVNALLGVIFDQRNLGRVELTNNVSPGIIAAIVNARHIMADNNADRRAENLNKLFDKYKDDLSVLKNITSAEQLGALAIRSAFDSSNASGYITINKNNKIVVRPSGSTVIKAIDASWMKSVLGVSQDDDTNIPEPTFNMHKFMTMLELSASYSEELTDELLKKFDSLLDIVGLPKGMYVSPTITTTNTPIAVVSADSISNFFETDIKRIKRPQVVLSTLELFKPGILKDRMPSLKKQVIDKKKKMIKGADDASTFTDGILAKAASLSKSKATAVEDWNDIVKEIEAGYDTGKIDDNTKTATINQVIGVFNSKVKIPKKLSLIDFSALIVKTEATSEFIDNLNTLKSLGITKGLATTIWSNLLLPPENMVDAQLEMLNNVATKIIELTPTTSKMNSKTAFELTSDIFNNNLLKNIVLVVADVDTKNRIGAEKEAMLGRTLTFPISYEASPEKRIQLLLDINSIDGMSLESMYNASEIEDDTIKNTFTKSPEENRAKVEIWIDNSLAIDPGIKPKSAQAVASIIADKDMFAFRHPIDINAALVTLLNTGNEIEYIDLLMKFKADVDDIYYNKENISYTNNKIREALALVKSPEALAYIETLNTDLGMENESIMKELQLNRETGFVENILGSISASKLSPAVLSQVTNILSKITASNEIPLLVKYVNSDYSEEEKRDGGLRDKTVQSLIEHVHNEYKERLAATPKDADTLRADAKTVTKFLAGLASDHDVKCFF